MIRLIGSRRIQALLSGAPTTTQPSAYATFVDVVSDQFGGEKKYYKSTVALTGATAVDIVDAPGGNIIRQVDFICVRNADSVAATVTVRVDDGGSTFTLAKVALAVGDHLIYAAPVGWYVVQADGSIRAEPLVLSGIRLGNDKTDSSPSFSGTTVAGASPAFRLTHPVSGTNFYITPYNSGVAIEYNGTLEVWSDDFSIHNNNVGGGALGNAPRFWVGDNKDLGGLRMSGVTDLAETLLYTEIVSERFSGASHGDIRLIVRDAADGWDFRQGASGADASKVKILASGRVLVNTTVDGGANLRVATSAGAEPNANENTSVVALVSTATAGVDVGPSLRFMGESGNGVTPYSFAMIQGYKASATAGDYSGGLRFSLVTAAGGVVAPMLLTQTGLNSTAIGATSPSTGAFTTLSASGLISADGGQIKFPATQNPSSDVNTLDDYEEGTWTPNDSSGASLSFTSPTGTYTRVGRLVTITGSLVYPATASGLQAFIGGLPFTVATNAVGSSYNTSGVAVTALAVGGYALLALQDAATGAAITNAGMTGAGLVFTLSYEV